MPAAVKESSDIGLTLFLDKEKAGKIVKDILGDLFRENMAKYTEEESIVSQIPKKTNMTTQVIASKMADAELSNLYDELYEYNAEHSYEVIQVLNHITKWFVHHEKDPEVSRAMVTEILDLQNILSAIKYRCDNIEHFMTEAKAHPGSIFYESVQE